MDRFEPYHVLVMLGIQLVGGWGGFPLHQIKVSTRQGFPVLENAPKISKKLSLPQNVKKVVSALEGFHVICGLLRPCGSF